jgi:hypothetical protein
LATGKNAVTGYRLHGKPVNVEPVNLQPETVLRQLEKTAYIAGEC